jgi:hypothetical protein
LAAEIARTSGEEPFTCLKPSRRVWPLSALF